MFSKQQKRRLLIVLLAPAFIAGLWLSNGGYKKFIYSEYYGFCDAAGCGEVDISYAEKLKDFNAIYAGFGSYLFSPGYHGHIIIDGLKQVIVDARTRNETFISLPKNKLKDKSIFRMNDDCMLKYNNVDHIEFHDSGKVEYIRGPESHHGLFEIQCGHEIYAGPFYFKKPETHDLYARLLLESHKISNEWYGKQNTIATISFFVPFLFLAAVWFSTFFICWVISFVRFGSGKTHELKN